MSGPRIPGLIITSIIATAHVLALAGEVDGASVAAADQVPVALEPVAAADSAPVSHSALGIGEILDRYNDGIRRALEGIESLRVAQTMFEPQDDGSSKRACAILTYERGAGMVREETFSEITYPAGEYTLSSLVGPRIDSSEYDIEYGGAEEQEGYACHRLDVTAAVRDHRHFDGSIWISSESFAPVRIVGAVADPPFPAKEIRLDKLFCPAHEGIWLVRRHIGRGEFSFLFASKRGERRLFYDDYDIRFVEPAPEACRE